MASTLFPTSTAFGAQDAWYAAASVDGQLKGTEEVWDGSGMKTDGELDESGDEPAPEIVDGAGAPIVIHDAVIAAPVAPVARKPWGSVTLSTGKLYTKDQVVPDAEFPTSRHHPDFELALNHNKFVGKGKKFAASKARLAAAEKAAEEAARKEASEKATAQKSKVVVASAAATKPTTKPTTKLAIRSGAFAALDDDEED